MNMILLAKKLQQSSLWSFHFDLQLQTMEHFSALEMLNMVKLGTWISEELPLRNVSRERISLDSALPAEVIGTN